MVEGEGRRDSRGLRRSGLNGQNPEFVTADVFIIVEGGWVPARVNLKTLIDGLLLPHHMGLPPRHRCQILVTRKTVISNCLFFLSFIIKIFPCGNGNNHMNHNCVFYLCLISLLLVMQRYRLKSKA